MLKRVLPVLKSRSSKAFACLLRVAAVALLGLPLQAAAVDMLVSRLTDTPDPAVRGGTMVYSASVTNNTSDIAHGVKIVFTLDAQTDFVSVSDPACLHDAPSNKVTCSYATMAGDGAGAGAGSADIKDIDLSVRVAAGAGQTVNLQAAVSTSDPDSNAGNNSLTQLTTIGNGADLALVLSGSPSSLMASGSLVYTASLNNNGPDVAGATSATFTLSPNLSYKTATGSGWSCGAAGQVVTCTRPSSAKGALPVITINTKATGTTTGTITSTGVVTISGSATDFNNANDASSVNTTITVGTDLAVSKTVSKALVGSGQALAFTLAPRNLGPMTATNVVVSDSVPAGFAILSASGAGWTCAISGQDVSCSRASYAAGAANDILISVTAPTVVAQTNVTNTATIGSDTPDGDPANNSGSVNVSIVPDGVDLAIAKTKTPNPVAQGNNMLSTLNVRNLGPRAAAIGEVKIVETLQVGETFVSASGSNWVCAPQVGQDITCTYNATLALNATTPNLLVTTTATLAGTLTNTACAVFTDSGGVQTDPVAANNCVSATSESTQTPNAADLQLSKAALPATLDWNAPTITYTLVVTNAGPGVSTSAILSDPIPGFIAGKTVVTALKTGGSSAAPFSCTPGATVTCFMSSGSMAVGETVEITVTVTRPLLDSSAQANNRWTNTASVRSNDQGDPVPSNNTASANVTVDPVSDLSITNTVTPGSVPAGTNATYVLTINNNGPSTANGVTVSDLFSIPEGSMSFLSASASNGGSCVYDAAAKKLDCNFGNMASGATRTVTITVRPDYMDNQPSPRTIGSTASVATTGNDSNFANNSDSSTLAVTPATLDLLVNNTDNVDPMGFVPAAAGPVFPDNVVTYRNNITNRGPSVATHLKLTYLMKPPAGKSMTFLGGKLQQADTSYTNYCDQGNTQVTGPAQMLVTCNFPTSDILLGNNATTDLYLDFRVDTQPTGSGDTYQSTVTVSSREPEALMPNNAADQSTTIKMRVDLKMSKAAFAWNGGANALATAVQLRQPFFWVLTLNNAGPGNSGGTVINDVLPAGLSIYTGGAAAPYNAAPYNAGLSWSTNNAVPSNGSCSGGATISCSVGLLESGKLATVRIPVIATAVNPALENCATATTIDVERTAADNRGCATIAVQPSSIAGFVYEDGNNDAAKGPGESGIAGVTLRLEGIDLYGNTVSNVTTITTAGGAYAFNNLSPGTYKVSEVQPATHLDGKDAAGTSAGTASDASGDEIGNIVLAASTNATGYLFGELKPATLSGFVFVDLDKDAMRDLTGVPATDEGAGVTSVTMTLSGSDDLGPVNATVQTGVNGSYSFANLRPGTYQVVQATLSGVTHTGMTIGSKGGNDGASALAANTPVLGLSKRTIGNVQLVSGDAAINYNFGETGQGLGGAVYADLNNNGVKDAGEPGIPGVQVTLSGNTATGASVCVEISPNPCTIVTDSNGSYSFTGLPSSDATGYVLSEQAQATAPLSNYADGIDAVGTVNGVPRGSMTNDRFSGIVIGTGQFGSNYNFGESTASLSGKVYLDADRSNTLNGADTLLPNVTVTLSGTTATGANVCSIVSTCVGQTDANGNYSFTGLPASNGAGYSVTETQPVDFVDATNTLGTGATVPGTLGVAGNSAFNGVVLGAGQKGIDYLFGEATGKLSGFVYADKNNNGLMEAGEAGIGGVSLVLTGTSASGGSACGAPICTATTNPDGSYSFSFLRNANGAGYTVSETQPAAYLDGITRKGNVGGVPCAACVDNAANVIGSIAYAVDKTHTDFNFGELLPASVSGAVYADSNQNAILDKDEQIAGVIITLSGIDDRGAPVNLSTTSAADGSYRFDKLRPSSGAGYSVTETHPAGFNDFPGNTGSLPGTIGGIAVGTAAPNSIGGLPLLQGDAGVNYNFREVGASIGGAVYFDANNNGLRDSGEPPFPGVTVRLAGPSPRTVLTGADGSFLFTGLMAGNYSIVETQPGGVIDGADSAGSLGGTINAPKNSIGGINLAPGAAGVNYLFGERNQAGASGSLAGTVYVDANKDGKRDSGEQLLAGVTLTLSGVDAKGAPVTLTTQTDANGNYLFPFLVPGTYHLAETQPEKLSDFEAATGTKIGTLGGGAAGLNSVTAILIPAMGGAATGYDFREFSPNAQVVGPAKLGGHVYVDANKNAKMEAGEALAGVTVTLSGVDANGVAIAARSTQTGADGSYLFENLVPGTYTVVESQPAAYGDFPANTGSAVGSLGGTLDAGPNKIGSIVLVVGNNGVDYDFRERGGSLAGVVYRDDNHNGVQDAGEPGIAGVPVSAIGSKGEAGRASTDADGRFLFVGLAADSYSLVETHPAAYIDGKETAGKIDGVVSGTVDNSGFDATAPKNSIGNITLGVAQDGSDYLFGERRARLEGYVYVDANNNGQMDAGETPLPGVHVTMTGGEHCAQGCVAVSGADGKYVFENLVPGRYTLVESQTDLPTSKYMDGKETAGVAGGTVDNSSFGTAPSQNTIAQIDVTSDKLAANNGVIGGNLFGERVRPGPETRAPIISGYVWLDREHTRKRPDQHEGVKDWTVTLIHNGKPICTVKSDANGFYQFDNLRCAGYKETGLPTGPGFEIRFTKDGNGMPNVPTSAGNAGKPAAGVIQDITLLDNSDITEQNLPLNPSGVVYDSVTRQPVRGAQVSVSGPAGFDPAHHLLGGLEALKQTTGSDGVYQFVLINNFPAGTYKLAISAYPVGYVPAESARIPSCQGAATIVAKANAALIQKSDTAPAPAVALHKPNACVGAVPGGADTTQYYYTFTVGTDGAPILNNHLPIDKIEAAGLALTKTGDKQQLEFGESLLYTLTVRQTSGSAVAQATVRDSLPAGFVLVPGSVKVDGKPVADPAVASGPVLAFNLGPLASNKQAVLTYRLRAGVGSLQGDGINRAIAYACNVASGCVLPASYQPVPDAYPSNRAEYKVRLNAGVFTSQACVAGKVFVDCNGNSVQDSEELGIPGVRLYLEDGTSFTTDVEGKYSYCGLSPKSHVIKADSLTLPRGSRLTTTSNRNLGDANSIWLDAKNGELLRADFAEGACSAPVIEQVKARRSQGGTRAPETEAARLPGLKFDSKAPAAPRQATDSANQELVKPRQGAIPAGAGEARAQ